MIARTLLTLCFLCVTALALPQHSADGVGDRQSANTTTQSFDNTQYLNANKILMMVSNHGTLGYDLAGVFGYGYGTFYPYTSIAEIQSGANTSSPLFAAGPWMGGLVDGEVRVALSGYDFEYAPGPMKDGTSQSDRPQFRVYKLYSDSLESNPNDDYAEWPVDQGAPVDSEGKPAMRGSQMIWTVFNDANPLFHEHSAGGTAPLGVEVQFCAWGSNSSSLYEGVVYLEYKLINKGGNIIRDYYFGLFADPDVGGSSDDMTGCQPDENLSFAYNDNNHDAVYGTTPPAIGFKFDNGPLESSPDSIAYINGMPVPNCRVLKMRSFVKWTNGTEPDNPLGAYCCLRGMKPTCDPYIPYGSSSPTVFMHSGDPVTGTGDLDVAPGDRRMLTSVGPTTFFLPADTQTISIRMGIARGGDRLSSISALKYYLRDIPSWSGEAQTTMTSVLNSPAYDDTVRICVGDLDYGTAEDIYPTSLIVNRQSINCVATVLPSHPQFTGSVMEFAMKARDFIDSYDFNSGQQIQPYGLYFTSATGNSFIAIGEVAMVDMLMGDLNGDRGIDISDLTYLVNSLFLLGPEPASLEAANLNCDEAGAVDISDLTMLVNHLFITFEPLLPCP